LGDDTISSPAPQQQQQQQQPNLMLAQPMSFDTLVSNQSTTTPPIQPQNAPAASQTAPQKSELPGGIWSQASNLISLDSLGAKNTPVKTTNTGPSMNSLKNNSVNAGWNNWASANATPTSQQPPKQSSAFDDLLF
jgi:epsin